MRVLGALCCGFELSEDGIGWVILEWRDDVLLGIMRLLSLWSRVLGRASRSLVRGRVKDVCVLKEGAILLIELPLAGEVLYSFLSVIDNIANRPFRIR